MDIKDFFLEPIKQRIFGLKNEISLIDKQISISTSTRPFKSIPHMCLDKNIKTALYNVYLKYYQLMDQILAPTCQLKKFLSCHFYAFSSNDIQTLLQILYGHKSALLNLLNDSNKINFNEKFPKLTKTTSHDFSYIEEDPVDISLSYFLQVFPFEISAFLIQNTTFFTFFLRTMVNYNPNHHEQTVRLISETIRKIFVKNPISKKSIYSKDQHVLCFLLAEHFISVFANKAMIQNTNSKRLDNFSTIQKCSIIVKNGLLNSTLNQSMIDSIHSYSSNLSLSNATSSALITSPACTFSSASLNSVDDSDDNMTLNCISLNVTSKSHHKTEMIAFSEHPERVRCDHSIFNEMECIEIENFDNLIVPELKFAIYEIQKISIQPSPSLMLFVLTQAIDFVSTILSVDGTLIGADETFPFFVYCIVHAKIPNLPSIINFLSKYVDCTLRDSTRYGYDIQRLTASYEFIEKQELPVQKYLIFPFSQPPPVFESILIPVSKTPITLKGVELYATPLWNRHPKLDSAQQKNEDIIFPAFFRCTGSNEQSYGYLYELSSEVKLKSFNFPEESRIVLTTQGSLVHITESFIQKNMMIKVDGGNYEQSLDDIQLVSSMILLTSFNKDIKNPSISKKQMIFDQFIKQQWLIQFDQKNANQQNQIDKVRIIVANVQMALAILGKLPPSYQITGNMDYETLTAIKYVMRYNKAQTSNLMHPKVFNYIQNLSKSTTT